MNITLFLSSLFFVLDEFPEWECREAVNFVLDKQYSISALCPMQCDNKVQKLSASALEKMAKLITNVKLDNSNEQITVSTLYTLIIIVCVQTVCMLVCGWKTIQNSKRSANGTQEMTEMNDMKEEPTIKEENV